VYNKYRVLVINQGFVLLIKVSAKNKSEALLNPLLLIHANVSDFIILVYLKKISQRTQPKTSKPNLKKPNKQEI
jgi:hypothetical protein